MVARRVFALLAAFSILSCGKAANTITDAAKSTIFKAIDDQQSSLANINREIHSNPETVYEEVHAHQVLTDYLEEQGFTVTRGDYNLSTAFRAEFSRGAGRAVSFNAEYDALPGIGHACGHNLIATSSVAAAIGVKAVLESGNITGSVVLLGTPAEEGGGGKIRMIEAGAYKGLDCSLMAHPGQSSYVAYAKLLSVWSGTVEYHGYSTHAALTPFLGRNALDAFVAAYSMVGLLRQQIRPTERIHGMVTNGGVVPNVIPDYTNSNWIVRSPTLSGLAALLARVKNVFESAGTSTNTTAVVNDTQLYYDQRPSIKLAGVYYNTFFDNFNPAEDTQTSNFTTRTFEEELDSDPGSASSDQGNVSYELPAMQANFPIGGAFSNHNAGFTVTAGTEFALAQSIIAVKTWH